MKRSIRARKGFTLVELLVVIGIIALLISILLPTLARARESAKAIKCGSNARQITQGLIGYSTDFQGSLPLGHAMLGYPVGHAFAIQGVPTKPAPRTFAGWTHAVSGYLNPARANGFDMPLSLAAFSIDLDDSWHPVLYCPSVSSDFANAWTHYGINRTMMPDWNQLNSADPFAGADLYAPSVPPMNMSQMYADNAIVWDGQQQNFDLDPQIFNNRDILGQGGFFYIEYTPAMQGVDGSAMWWGMQDRNWDRIYRQDEGESPDLAGNFEESAEYPVQLPKPGEQFGLLAYGDTGYFGNTDFWIFNGFIESDFFFTPIFRHSAETRCNTGFVDGSVQGLGWQPKESHPFGNWYATGDWERRMLRPKFPNPLPREKP